MNSKQNGFGTLGVLLLVTIILVVGGVGTAVWRKQNSTKTSESSSPIKNVTAKVETNETAQKQNYYKVESLRIQFPISDQIQDVRSKVNGDFVWFTLESFLQQANNSGYSRVDNGKNNCEELFGLRLFKDAAQVRSFGTEVTGDLIDDSAKPIQGRIIQLADGRYALPQSAQALCSKDSSFDNSPTAQKETDAKDAIRSAVTAGLSSY